MDQKALLVTFSPFEFAVLESATVALGVEWSTFLENSVVAAVNALGILEGLSDPVEWPDVPRRPLEMRLARRETILATPATYALLQKVLFNVRSSGRVVSVSLFCVGAMLRHVATIRQRGTSSALKELALPEPFELSM